MMGFKLDKSESKYDKGGNRPIIGTLAWAPWSREMIRIISGLG